MLQCKRRDYIVLGSRGATPRLEPAMITPDLVQRLRQDYCACHEYYRQRDLTDPQCESCSTKDERHECATAIETLQSELERERKRADEAEREFNNCRVIAMKQERLISALQSRLDAIEAMAQAEVHKCVTMNPVVQFILDGKEKL